MKDWKHMFRVVNCSRVFCLFTDLPKNCHKWMRGRLRWKQKNVVKGASFKKRWKAELSVNTKLTIITWIECQWRGTRCFVFLSILMMYYDDIFRSLTRARRICYAVVRQRRNAQKWRPFLTGDFFYVFFIYPISFIEIGKNFDLRQIITLLFVSDC